MVHAKTESATAKISSRGITARIGPKFAWFSHAGSKMPPLRSAAVTNMITMAAAVVIGAPISSRIDSFETTSRAPRPE
jgi:hypothetical protein